MKTCLIGPGYKPIPPRGWGAVESLIYDYYLNLKSQNLHVDIINNRNLNEVVKIINRQQYDIVYIMYDDYIVLAPHVNAGKILYMSHYAYITHPSFEKKYSSYFKNIFQKVIDNQEFITINAISNEIKEVYIKYGFPENKINVIPNGAREDAFIFHAEPLKTNKSIYLGKIENRKGQYKYQTINGIDFVGNYSNSSFDINSKNYLGEWDKDTLYKNLSHYGNLILLSDGEADPLVVKEALICGLGVVVSECSSANLDKTDFITIIPDDKLLDINYVTREIIKNRLISIQKRDEIRDYGMNKFSWKNIIDNFISICHYKNVQINKVTAVTALFDINREKNGDGRSIDYYLSLLNKTLQLNVSFVIFCEEKLFSKVSSMTRKNPETKIITMNPSDIEYFKYIKTVEKITKSDDYLSKIMGRNRLEVKLPAYNLLIMNKMNFMNIAAENNYFDSNFFIWVDAGSSRFFGNHDIQKNIKWPVYDKLDYNKFNIQIKKTLFSENDIDKIMYHNDHFTTATIFGGNPETIKRFMSLIRKNFDYMINKNCINNEQITLAMIYKQQPKLFNVYINKTNNHLPYFPFLSNV